MRKPGFFQRGPYDRGDASTEKYKSALPQDGNKTNIEVLGADTLDASTKEHSKLATQVIEKHGGLIMQVTAQSYAVLEQTGQQACAVSSAGATMQHVITVFIYPVPMSLSSHLERATWVCATCTGLLGSGG